MLFLHGFCNQPTASRHDGGNDGDVEVLNERKEPIVSDLKEADEDASVEGDLWPLVTER